MIKLNKIQTKQVTDAFAKYGEAAVKEIGKIVDLTGDEVEARAKTFAPVDDGTLQQSIRNEKQQKPLTTKVTAYARYSAFQEFGTGGLVTIPDGWGSMAAQFKGKGIKQINLFPQPFMYPAYLHGKKTFKADIKDTLKYLNRQFNNG